MDGGANHPPFMRQQTNNKRNFSTMSASHRDSSSSSSTPRDDHYENEHAARRRRHRFHSELRLPRSRYPGDGFDFRRPAMLSRSLTANDDGNADVNARRTHDAAAAAVIDLTDEDGGAQSRRNERVASSTAEPAHAVRPPATARDVIDIESSGDEVEHDTSHFPGAEYLALPRHAARSRYARLRRPLHMPSPPAEMDDIQFIEQRPRSRPATVRGRSASPAHHSPQPQRSSTPYLNGSAETIDLTEDNEDEIVHLNTRQRQGVNQDPPQAADGAAPRSFADRGFDHMGHIANLLRENIGGRLYQRIQDFRGREEDRRLGELALQNIPVPGHRHHQHHHGGGGGAVRHRHHHHRPHAEAAQIRHPAGIRIMQEMPQMMDYNMTAFDMGLGGAPGRNHNRHHNNRPPSPKYEPPPPAEEGFTRSPGEDDVVVCPNCGDELAVGAEGAKQEVWIVKGCGHAYCGECAQNRSRPVNKKGKGKEPMVEHLRSLPPPFKKCVVEGCGKPAASKSMILVYLGS